MRKQPFESDVESGGAVWIGNGLYCKTPEELERTLQILRDLGYSLQNNRVDSYSAIRDGVSPEQMEKEGWSLWHASLRDILKGKCKSCDSLINTLGIRKHGHACENCGEPTYLSMVEESTIRFSFVSDKHDLFGPELNMEVVCWDHENGWLYLKEEPLEGGGLNVVCGKNADEYLAKYSDKWSKTNVNGQSVLKMRYFDDRRLRKENVFEVRDIWGSHVNHKIVKVWDGVEYGEYDRNFPLQDSFSIYEAWHWAPLGPSPELHERVIAAAGQVSSADYYHQDCRNAWSRDNYAYMGIFIRHFTTLDPDEWDRVVSSFPLDGPGGIAAVAKFCHPYAEVRYEPNVGNFLNFMGGVLAGKKFFSDREIMAAEHALLGDDLTQELVRHLNRRNARD